MRALMKVDQVRSFVAFSTLVDVLDELQLNWDFALSCSILFRSYSDNPCSYLREHPHHPRILHCDIQPGSILINRRQTAPHLVLF